jgi:hypothetical protein
MLNPDLVLLIFGLVLLVSGLAVAVKVGSFFGSMLQGRTGPPSVREKSGFKGLVATVSAVVGLISACVGLYKGCSGPSSPDVQTPSYVPAQALPVPAAPQFRSGYSCCTEWGSCLLVSSFPIGSSCTCMSWNGMFPGSVCE